MKSEEVVRVLDALAQKLGTTAEYLIPLFARRQVGGALAEIVVLAVIAAIGYRAWKWRPSEDAVDESDGLVYILKWAGVLVATIAGSVFLLDIVSTLASPEAAAIADLLSSLRGK